VLAVVVLVGDEEDGHQEVEAQGLVPGARLPRDPALPGLQQRLVPGEEGHQRAKASPVW